MQVNILILLIAKISSILFTTYNFVMLSICDDFFLSGINVVKYLRSARIKLYRPVRVAVIVLIADSVTKCV